MNRPAKHQPPAAVEHALQLWVWIDGHLQHLPTHARASAGAALVATSLALLNALNRAAWKPHRSADARVALREACEHAAFLRLLVRGMHVRQYFSDAQYEYAAKQVETLGRMVAGWLRASEDAPRARG